jgi:miniconductance mechanosensitive channel
MISEQLQAFIDEYPTLGPWAIGGAAVILSVIVFLIARFLVARGLVYIAGRTANKFDDILVEKLRPYRFAWLAPLLAIYFLAPMLPDAADGIRRIVLFLILWLVLITISSLFNALNAIYEASSLYRGEPIQGYLDLLRIVLILAAIIISISLFTGQSVLVLLGGLGAVMAVLLLIFRDTLLSFVASVQIQSNDLIKEGDWLEVPSYGADGEVVNMALHTVTIQNWDKTLTMIPTYKLMEVPYKNWRGMEESGGRRIKRAVHVDLNSVRFVDRELVERLRRIDLVRQYLEDQLAKIEQRNVDLGIVADTPIESPQVTNIEVFQAYVQQYLLSRPDLHQGMTLLVRQLPPGPNGLPVEVYGFTRTTDWAEYEAIQAEIVDHLLASIPGFDLRVFQEPTGLDFRAAYGVRPGLAGEAL